MAKHKGSRRANGTGGIFRDGDTWRVRIAVGVDPSTGKTKFRSARATTQAEAVEASKRLEADFRTGKLGPSKGATVAEYLNHWLIVRVKPLRAPSTYRQYKWLVQDHLIPHLGKKKLDKVTRPEVQALLAAKANQTVKSRSKTPSEAPGKILSRATLRLIRVVLHAAYEDAIRDGMAARNPAQYIELPQEPKKPPVFVTSEQIPKLVEALKGSPVGPVVRFMLATGTRLGEATGLRWQDIDAAEKFVHIRGQLQRSDGKLTYRPITKTNQDRSLPIPAWLATELEEIRTQQMVEESRDPDGIVFLNPEGRRIDPKYLHTHLAAACVAAKLPPVSPHKLRHTAATLALQETGDLHGVQKMLGHQQVSLTADLYGHATTERLRGVMDAVGKVIKPDLVLDE